MSDRVLALTQGASTNVSGTTLLNAHIAVLTSALGGPDHTSPLHPPPYKLGDDAWACLKDLKRWLITVDQEQRKFDVANACAETGLVLNDLCTILATWEVESDARRPPSHIMGKPVGLMNKIALLCLELFVQLTWPVEIVAGESTRSQARHSAKIQNAQLLYKNKAMQFAGGKVLKAAIRLAIPVIAKEKRHRDARDQQILLLVVYFFRNLAEIRPLPLTKLQGLSKKSIANHLQGVGEEEVGLAATVAAFERNQVLRFLVTVTSLLGEEFEGRELEWLCFEVVVGILREVEVGELYPPVAPHGAPPTAPPGPPHGAPPTAPPGAPHTTPQEPPPQTVSSLGDLLAQEKTLLDRVKLKLATRHANFGTLLSLQTPAQRYTVSGQKGLASDGDVLARLDAGKRPYKAVRDVSAAAGACDRWIPRPAGLPREALAVVQVFTEEMFLAFNGLMDRVTGALTAEFESVGVRDKARFCQGVSWFLRAHRARTAASRDAAAGTDADATFPSLALTNVTYILLKKLLREHEGLRDWAVVHVALAAVGDYLQTLHALSATDSHTAHAIALNVYDDPFALDLFVRLTKQAAAGSRGVSHRYMGAAIEAAHWFLRVIEACANRNQRLTVRPRRGRKQKSGTGAGAGTDNGSGSDSGSDEPPPHLLDPRRYEAAFIAPAIVLTHVAYLHRYADLSPQQVRCVLKYFHRVFVKHKRHALMFRVDLARLLQQMMLTVTDINVLQEVRGFAKYYTKTLVRTLAARPSLFVEMMFVQKPAATRHYLDTGERSAPGAHAARGDADSDDEPFAADALEFAREVPFEQKIAIVVAAMIDDGDAAVATYAHAELARVCAFRIARNPLGELPEVAMELTPHDALLTHGYLRLLLRTIGFDLAHRAAEPTVLPADVDSDHLELSRDYVAKYLVTPVDLGGREAAELIRVAAEDDYFGGAPRAAPADQAAPAAPTAPTTKTARLVEDRLGMPKGLARKKSAKPDAKKQRREPRAVVPAPVRSFKSSAFVHDSDDDEDTEEARAFFAREERLRQVVEQSAYSGGLTGKALEEFISRWDGIARAALASSASTTALEHTGVAAAVARAKSAVDGLAGSNDEVASAAGQPVEKDGDDDDDDDDDEIEAAIEAVMAAVDEPRGVLKRGRESSSDDEGEGFEDESQSGWLHDDSQPVSMDLAQAMSKAGESDEESDDENADDRFHGNSPENAEGDSEGDSDGHENGHSGAGTGIGIVTDTEIVTGISLKPTRRGRIVADSDSE